MGGGSMVEVVLIIKAACDSVELVEGVEGVRINVKLHAEVFDVSDVGASAIGIEGGDVILGCSPLGKSFEGEDSGSDGVGEEKVFLKGVFDFIPDFVEGVVGDLLVGPSDSGAFLTEQQQISLLLCIRRVKGGVRTELDLAVKKRFHLVGGSIEGFRFSDVNGASGHCGRRWVDVIVVGQGCDVDVEGAGVGVGGACIDVKGAGAGVGINGVCNGQSCDVNGVAGVKGPAVLLEKNLQMLPVLDQAIVRSKKMRMREVLTVDPGGGL
ncbi:hypothetical protein K474DRAFT_1680240 [Panus rudis PR-1116 ss-1]|nr:hypothetical protein K474DRAFT_1680240 [Panus rudis PR-1116 ss-1]